MNEFLKDWNKRTDNRVVLQYAYALLALTALVVAGLASLLNYELGQEILVVAFGLTIIFFVNAVMWVLLDAFILSRFSKPSPRKKQ